MILRKNLVFRAISLVLVVSLTTWLTSNPIKLVYAKDTDSQTSQVSAQQKETRGPCEGDTPDAESVPVSTDNNFDQTLVKEFSGVTIKHVAHMPPELTDKNEARSNFISSSIQTPNNISETFPKSHQYTTEPEAVRLKLVNTSDAKDHGTEELDHFPIKNQEGLYSVEFCEESGRGLVKFTHKESSLNLEPFGVDVSKGRSNTNTILYPNIYESVDLKYTLEDYRLKEELILNKPADTNEFTFRLEITDLEIERRWDRIVFLNNETKEPVFYMPKPYALDDEGRTCDSISWNLSDNGVLKITLDSEWLKNATYPVVIDPSITLSGVEIHQASQEFGTIQGYKNWFYEHNWNNSGQWTAEWMEYLPELLGSFDYWQGYNNYGTYCYIGRSYQIPASIESARTWRGYGGAIKISGNVRKAQTGGDGVYVRITNGSNNAQIWPQSGWHFIGPNDLNPVNINLILNYTSTYNLRFIVHQNQNSTSDKVIWDPIITQFQSEDDYYHASTDFSPPPCQRNWTYEEKAPNGTIQPMVWDANNSQWVGTSGAIIGPEWLKPGTNEAIRTWTAPRNGFISIRGKIQKIEAGGDGVLAKVLKNDTELWPTYQGQGNIGPGNLEGINSNLDTSVSSGDKIHFVLNQGPGGDSTFDKTYWDPIIVYKNCTTLAACVNNRA